DVQQLPMVLRILYLGILYFFCPLSPHSVTLRLDLYPGLLHPAKDTRSSLSLYRELVLFEAGCFDSLRHPINNRKHSFLPLAPLASMVQVAHQRLKRRPAFLLHQS
ncbi:hypothetical protein DL96DRAFT_1634311, partial [Flagelloscypha sp. PMI_526]